MFLKKNGSSYIVAGKKLTATAITFWIFCRSNLRKCPVHFIWKKSICILLYKSNCFFHILEYTFPAWIEISVSLELWNEILSFSQLYIYKKNAKFQWDQSFIFSISIEFHTLNIQRMGNTATFTKRLTISGDQRKSF